MMAKKNIAILVGCLLLLGVGLVIAVPKIQDFFYVKGIKEKSVNTFTAPNGTFTVQFITKTSNGSVYQEAYFSIGWKDENGKTLGSKDMKSDGQGIATAFLPAGTVRAGWSPASGDFYLPSDNCYSSDKGCDVALSPSIDVVESVLID